VLANARLPSPATSPQSSPTSIRSNRSPRGPRPRQGPADPRTTVNHYYSELLSMVTMFVWTPSVNAKILGPTMERGSKPDVILSHRYWRSSPCVSTSYTAS
jgi:hypothetical protein